MDEKLHGTVLRGYNYLPLLWLCSNPDAGLANLCELNRTQKIIDHKNAIAHFIKKNHGSLAPFVVILTVPNGFLWLIYWPQIARITANMGPTWVLSAPGGSQVGPLKSPWILLSGVLVMFTSIASYPNVIGVIVKDMGKSVPNYRKKAKIWMEV